MRRLGVDYGKRFALRLEVFMITMVFVNIISLLIVFLWLFQIYNLSDIYLVIAFFEITVITVIIFRILLKGAMINQQFLKYDEILTDHLILANTLKGLREPYFDKSLIPSNLIREKSID